MVMRCLLGSRWWDVFGIECLIDGLKYGAVLCGR